MKKNQHIVDKQTYKRYKDKVNNPFMIKNGEVVSLDWSEFNNRLIQEFYWESEVAEENELEDLLSIFEKNWGLIRNVFVAEVKTEVKLELWQSIYLLYFCWTKAKVDDLRVYMYRNGSNDKKISITVLTKLLKITKEFTNTDYQETGVKFPSKKDFLIPFFRKIKGIINREELQSYPLLMKKEKTTENILQQKYDLEKKDFDSPIFWFIREMQIFAPEIHWRREFEFGLMPFQRKLDLDLFFLSAEKFNFNKEHILRRENLYENKETNLLSRYKYVFILDENISFWYRKKALDEEVTNPFMGPNEFLLKDNIFYMDSFLEEKNIDQLVEIFADWIGIDFMPFRENRKTFQALENMFIMIQNDIEKCIFGIDEENLIKAIKERNVPQNKTLINLFYEGYLFKKIKETIK